MMHSGNRMTPWTSLRLGQLWALFVFGFAVLFSTGCDKKGDAASSEVTGKVTLEGKAVAGNVIFIGSDNKEFSTLIILDGKYAIADLPAGDYKVTVVGALGTGGAGAPKGGPAMPGTGMSTGAAPPAKYAAAATSGLTFKRTTGKQEHNIALTP